MCRSVGCGGAKRVYGGGGGSEGVDFGPLEFLGDSVQARLYRRSVLHSLVIYAFCRSMVFI